MSDDEDLTILLRNSKNNIWEDKKRLGLLNDEIRSAQPVSDCTPCHTTQQQHACKALPKNHPCRPPDIRDHKKTELISKLTSSEGVSGLWVKSQSEDKHSPTVPDDVRMIQKEALISKLSVPEGLSGLGERKERSPARPVSPLPDDVRESKKEELITSLASSDGLVRLGDNKQSYHSKPTSPPPEDVRESKKNELISKLSSSEELAHLGEHKEKKFPQIVLPLPGDVRGYKKDELISRLTSAQGFLCQGEKEGQEEEAEPMVRFGEYSPQNPGLLSPGKTLLGLGEYEEKRRQILERKKREYLEQMAVARQAVKETKPQPEIPEFFLKTFMNSIATQTDPKLTGYIEGEDGVSPIAASTQTPGGEIPVPSIVSPRSHITTISTQTSGGKLKQLRYAPAAETSLAPGSVTTSYLSPSYVPLSPRERKLAEFRESYSPSFLQGLPVRQGVFDMLSSEPDVRQRREAYQEELRKQIEEKRRLEADIEEKERLKEAAIARRAELQRERMRQEYIHEEAVRRERHLLRLRQAEEFQRKQEALKLEQELEREAEARRKLERRLEELEADLVHNTTTYTAPQNLAASLPVPALRAKILKEAVQIQEPAAKPVESVSTKQRSSTGHKNKTKYSPQFSDSEYSVRGSHSDYNLNRYSPLKDSGEPITTVSYHRPPTDAMRAAGYSDEHVPSLTDENKNLVPEASAGHSQVPSEEVPQDSNAQKNLLENTMSIPILRAPSPVIPAARVAHSTTGSEAMQRLEAKWQVPAVEKTVINSDSNRILTQLGAVRHQLQLEQMRMEQQLQERLKHQS